MDKKVTVRLGANGPRATCDATGSVGEALAELLASGQPLPKDVIAAYHCHDVTGLGDELQYGGEIEPVFRGSEHGRRVYERSVCFLLSRTVHREFPHAAFRIHHTCGTGLFFTVEGQSGEDAAARISAAMRKDIAADIAIETVWMPYLDALEGFVAAGLFAKAHLLSHRSEPAVRLLGCGGFYDIWQGPVAPRTGLLARWRLFPWYDGFILQLPEATDPEGEEMAPWVPQRHLLKVFHEHARWGRTLGVETVGELNQAIASGRSADIIQMSEALHAQRLSDIAGEIAEREVPARLVLLAGPSSAGKTTTAKRLATNLRVRGLKPLLIGTDDYFLPPDQSPRDENGVPDFEHLEALDLPALNADLNALLEGRSVKRRVYDFVRQTPVWPGDSISLPKDGVLVMEGLHCLNPRLTAQVPDAAKFRVYLSALTQLGLDENNRISVTDNRLIRRMVRDAQFRGRGALASLQSWPSVRRGEERWIFPFQQLADATFNSSLDYELAVLRPYAERLLGEIRPDVPEYADARRLLRMLANVYPMESSLVPSDSILRESVGGSLFE